jgi:ferrous iron transport protein B
LKRRFWITALPLEGKAVQVAPSDGQSSGVKRTLLLLGNPNVGKSVFFGALTGRYATVSNYPGTTVEVCRGLRKDQQVMVIDMPGTNNLLPNSEDEQVTRDIILEFQNQPETELLPWTPPLH